MANIKLGQENGHRDIQLDLEGQVSRDKIDNGLDVR